MEQPVVNNVFVRLDLEELLRKHKPDIA